MLNYCTLYLADVEHIVQTQLEGQFVRRDFRALTSLHIHLPVDDHHGGGSVKQMLQEMAPRLEATHAINQHEPDDQHDRELPNAHIPTVNHPADDATEHIVHDLLHGTRGGQVAFTGHVDDRDHCQETQ